VGTFENIGNNHSPGDVLLEYTADGEMAIVQNGNAKTIKVCGCLAAGTTIATPSGPVSIEQLQAGDNILSTEQNGQMTIATITQIVESAAVKMMRIFSGGSYMDLTQGHPVFSPTLGRKISVDSLRAGMSLLALSGLLLTVDSVAAVHYPTPVYDLQTDAGRGYFAGVEELLVSSNQCNLYLSGRNFNTSQIETIEEAVSTSIEAFISDIEHSADLLDFFREASGDVLRGKAEAWRVALQAGTNLRFNTTALGKINYLKSKNISDAKLISIAQLDDIKAIELADNLARRSNPSVPQSVLDNLDVIAQKSKGLEVHDPTVMDKLKSLTSNDNFANPEELSRFLTEGLTNANPPTGSIGFRTELDDVLEGLSNGKRMHLSYRNPNYPNIDIDVFNETDNLIRECKAVSSSKFKTNGLGGIGTKYNSENALPGALRDQFNELHGTIDIKDGALLNQSESQILNHIKNYYSNDLPTSSPIKIGLDRLERLKIKKNGVDFADFTPSDWQQ
jgi:hypothetical protein